MTSKRTLRLALLALVVLVPLAIHEARFREGAKAAPTAHLRLSTVLKGFVAPTAVSFAPDGRIFVAEKQGFVVAYRSFADRRPRVIVDISRRVDSFVDRGLLSIALDPDFPLKPYLYLLYSLDAPRVGSRRSGTT